MSSIIQDLHSITVPPIHFILNTISSFCNLIKSKILYLWLFYSFKLNILHVYILTYLYKLFLTRTSNNNTATMIGISNDGPFGGCGGVNEDHSCGSYIPF